MVACLSCSLYTAGRPEIRGLPRFLLGQSMGGAVAIKALLKEPQEWDGLVLVAPMCKVTILPLTVLLFCKNLSIYHIKWYMC